MGCETACDDCSSSSSSNNNCSGASRLPDVEDYAREVEQLRARTRELEETVARLRDGRGQDNNNDDAAKRPPRKLRSSDWFNREGDPAMSALYVERHLNAGLTREELMSGRPIIGIAQSGSDIAPCNRHHIQLAKRVREGIRTAGGVALEFPTHPIQETTRRPTATLDRNLAYLGLVEVLHAYPLDGVVLLTGCDKTTPASLMAAATVNVPAVCLNVGPMLNGWDDRSVRDGAGVGVGAGTVVWRAREDHAAGRIGGADVLDRVAAGTPSPGHCNTMGTASTMNALAEALGMALPGTAAIPAPYRQRAQAAYETGVRIVGMVREDLRPSDVLTRAAFENAIVANTALGGSTNAPVHLNAVARHMGVALDLDDWDRLGYAVPLLVNVQPAGEMLGEDYYRAGGLPAVLAELLAAGRLPHPDAVTVNGRSIADNVRGRFSCDRRTIRPFADPLKPDAGFLHLRGNLFDSAIMKTSVISPDFRRRFLEDARDPGAFECRVAVFDGPEDYGARIDDAEHDDDDDERTMLVMRGVGPLGFPGAAEVVNRRAPARLLRRGVRELPCLGDGRQSGTSAAPSILHATPEAAAGGNLALLRDGDRVRVDLGARRRVDVLLSDAELAARRAELEARGGYQSPASATPWEDLFRREVGGLSDGMVFERALRFQRIAQEHPLPRDNH